MKQRIPTLENFVNENHEINYEINEGIKINVGPNSDIDKKSEMKAINSFKYIPPTKPVVVTDCNANFIDDFNTDIQIELSNGDKISFIVKESRTPVKGQSAPPYYTVELKINDKVIETDLDNFMDYMDGSWIEAILSYYYHMNPTV